LINLQIPETSIYLYMNKIEKGNLGIYNLEA